MAPERTSRTARIGIVEDEKGIIETLEAFLTHESPELKHIKREVVAFNFNSRRISAEEIVASNPSLLFMDYSLGSADGVNLTREIKELNPTIPVVLMSGTNMPAKYNAVVHGINEQLFAGILDKPFVRMEEVTPMVLKNIFNPIHVSFIGTGNFSQEGASHLIDKPFVKRINVYSGTRNFADVCATFQIKNASGESEKINVVNSLEKALESDIVFFCSDTHQNNKLAKRADRLDLLDISGPIVNRYADEFARIKPSALFFMVTNPNGSLLHILHEMGQLDSRQISAMIANDKIRFERAYEALGISARRLSKLFDIIGPHGNQQMLVPKKDAFQFPIEASKIRDYFEKARAIAEEMSREEMEAVREQGINYTLSPIEFVNAIEPFAHFKKEVGTFYTQLPISENPEEGYGFVAVPVNATYNGGIRLSPSPQFATVPKELHDIVCAERLLARMFMIYERRRT